MRHLIALLIIIPGLAIGQDWDMDPTATTLTYKAELVEVPQKIDFVLNIYEGTANVKYSEGVATIGNIKWKGTTNGISASTRLEEAIYTKKGKIRGMWDKSLKKRLESAILSEINFYSK